MHRMHSACATARAPHVHCICIHIVQAFSDFLFFTLDSPARLVITPRLGSA